jgi:hypothetical protein
MNEERIVRGGRALVLAGVMWSIMAVVQFRYGLFDHSAGSAYLAHQVVAMLAVALIIGGLWLLRRARVAGDGRYARAVLVLFVAGWVLILIGGLSNLASGDGTGPLATLGMVLPAVGGSFNTLTGLLLGVALARAGRLPGWRRWSVLVYALYYLVVLWLPVAVTGSATDADARGRMGGGLDRRWGRRRDLATSGSSDGPSGDMM